MFNFKVELIHATLNFPGSWYECRVAHSSGLIDPILKEHTSTLIRFAILYDSAFTASRGIEEKIVRGRKSNEVSEVSYVNSALLSSIDLISIRVLPSE